MRQRVGWKGSGLTVFELWEEAVWSKQEGVNKVPTDVLHPIFGSRPVHTEAGLMLHAFLGHACTLSTGGKPGSQAERLNKGL